MRFKKLSENQIECTITKQEMWEMGLEAKDFLGHGDRVEALLHEVLEEAFFELDVKDMGPFVNVQIALVPEGDLIMTISPMGASEGEGFPAILKHLSALREKLMQGKSENLENIHAVDEAVEDKSEEQANSDIRAFFSDKSDRHLWAELESLDHCIALAKEITAMDCTESSLYKCRGHYYMLVLCSKDKRKAANEILALSEHSMSLFLPVNGGDFIKEHGKVILVSNAIAQLSQI